MAGLNLREWISASGREVHDGFFMERVHQLRSGYANPRPTRMGLVPGPLRRARCYRRKLTQNCDGSPPEILPIRIGRDPLF
jgi:hypothetical protein